MFHGIYPRDFSFLRRLPVNITARCLFRGSGVDDRFLASSQCSILSTSFGRMFAGQLIPGAASEFLSSIRIDVSGQASRAALTKKSHHVEV